MILIIGRSLDAMLTAKDILGYMNIISDTVLSKDALAIAGERHKGVIIVGRDALISPEEYVRELRGQIGGAPVFAIREDLNPEVFDVFDGIYPPSVYSSRLVTDMMRLAELRAVTPPGRYRLGELDADSRMADATLGGEPLGLTKTEAMILRAVMAVYPEMLSIEDILRLAFRTGRQPESSGARTHICSINRQLEQMGSQFQIASEGEGYSLSEKRIRVSVD